MEHIPPPMPMHYQEIIENVDKCLQSHNVKVIQICTKGSLGLLWVEAHPPPSLVEICSVILCVNLPTSGRTRVKTQPQCSVHSFWPLMTHVFLSYKPCVLLQKNQQHQGMHKQQHSNNVFSNLKFESRRRCKWRQLGKDLTKDWT